MAELLPNEHRSLFCPNCGQDLPAIQGIGPYDCPHCNEKFGAYEENEFPHQVRVRELPDPRRLLQEVREIRFGSFSSENAADVAKWQDLRGRIDAYLAAPQTALDVSK